MKKTAIIYASVHHKNTERLLKEAVKNLNIDLLTVKEAESADLSPYEAAGFASGIYAGKLHASVERFIKNRFLGKGVLTQSFKSVILLWKILQRNCYEKDSGYLCVHSS